MNNKNIGLTFITWPEISECSCRSVSTGCTADNMSGLCLQLHSIPPSGQKTVHPVFWTPRGRRDMRGQENDTVIYRQQWEQLMSKDWPSLLENKDPDQKRLDETLMGTNWHKVTGERRREIKICKQKWKRQRRVEEVLGWLTSQKGNMVGGRLVGLNWDFHCDRIARIHASNGVPTANLVVTPYSIF